MTFRQFINYAAELINRFNSLGEENKPDKSALAHSFAEALKKALLREKETYHESVPADKH